MTNPRKVRIEITVVADDPESRASLAETLANQLSLDEVRTLTRIVREQPGLIQTAKGFLKGK